MATRSSALQSGIILIYKCTFLLQQNTSPRPLPHLVQVIDSNLSARSIPDWFCGFCRQMFYILDCGRLRRLQVWLLLSYDALSLETRLTIILGCIVCKVGLLKIELLWVRVCVCLSLRRGLLFPLNYVKSHSPHVNISSSLPAEAVTLWSFFYEKQCGDRRALFWQSWKVWWSMVLVRGTHSRQITIVFRSGMISIM